MSDQLYEEWRAACDRVRELEQQFAEAQKQIVMLREALDMAQWGDFHFDHTGDGQHYCPECGNLARQSHATSCAIGIALAATADLSNCILCDAEPAGTFLGCVEEGKAFQATHPKAYPLYKERTK
jgi:hypothetical protein